MTLRLLLCPMAATSSFFDRDNGDSRVLGRRFDADGNPVGDFFEVDGAASIGFPEATLLDNGLIAVIYTFGPNIELILVATEALDVVLSDEGEKLTGTIEGDTINGAGGDDEIFGGDGDDILADGTGNDTMGGGAGNDLFIAGAGGDTYLGDDGIDTIDFSGSDEGAVVTLGRATAPPSVSLAIVGEGVGGDASGDTYLDVENVIGTASGDDLSGDFNNNTLFGGADMMTGGVGDDALFANIESAPDDDGFGGNIFGGSGNDLLVGDAAINSLSGGTGDDNLFGGSSFDFVNGDQGNDTLFGGAGGDLMMGMNSASTSTTMTS